MKPTACSKKPPTRLTSYYRRNTKRCNQEARAKRSKPMTTENGGKKAC